MVDLPTPGEPVMPMTLAEPALPCSPLEGRQGLGRAVVQQTHQPGGHAHITGNNGIDCGTGCS